MDDCNFSIGIDVSTTACKIIIWDPLGRVVQTGRAGLAVVMPQTGWHEQPAESWWRALCRALRQALRGIEPGRLAGLAIAHQRETFVALDELGRPLRNGILWMDERAGGLLPELAKTLGAEAFHRTTGKPLSGNLTVSKIAWLREYEPEVFQKTRYYLEVHAYLVYRLTGQFATGWGCADPTGLFDMTHQDWAKENLLKLGLRPDQFPPVFPAGARLGEVSPAAARVTGLPAGLPVYAGLGDGQAGGMGANICQPGTAYLTLGTSVISGTFSNRYLVNPAFRTMTGGILHTYLLETVLLGGTYTLDWLFKSILGKSGTALARQRQAFEAELDQVPPGSSGLLLVPYWNSAMNPYWDASASGVIFGLRGNHTPVQLYRAILEGIGFELRLQLESVEAALGQPIDSLVVMGGGARSAGWCQIIADITGKPVVRLETEEAAALGAGILVAAGSGLYAGIAQAAQAMSRRSPDGFDPNSKRSAYYQVLYEDVYRLIYPALRQSMARLAELIQAETGATL